MRGLWIKAWLLCGTLDIVYASITALVLGRSPLSMLRGIATGPFGADAANWGIGGSAVGLATHFLLMAVIVSIGLWAARETPLNTIAPWKAGTLYGIAVYAVMYGIVLQLRFGMPFPDANRIKLANELFPHIFLVGKPLFYLARRNPA